MKASITVITQTVYQKKKKKKKIMGWGKVKKKIKARPFMTTTHCRRCRSRRKKKEKKNKIYR